MTDLFAAFAVVVFGVVQVLAWAAVLMALKHQRSDLEHERRRNARLMARGLVPLSERDE